MLQKESKTHIDGTTKSRKFAHVRSAAFTTSEVLIVLGILGVIAALTLPGLIQSNNERIKLVKLRKVYAMLSEAHEVAVSVNGPMNTWFKNVSDYGESSTVYAEKMLESMSVIRDCKLTPSQKCFGLQRTSLLNGTDDNYYDGVASYYKTIISSGASVAYYVSYSTTSSQASDAPDTPFKKRYGIIFVDIDGPKQGPSIWGVDFFAFAVTKDGVYPYGTKLDKFGKDDDALKANCFNTGYYCSGWVLETGNFDYLKADRTGKCPNGTQLSYSSTSCN